MNLSKGNSTFVIWIVFLAPFSLFLIPLMEGKVIFWGTAGLQFIPWRVYGFALLKEGVFPFWNPLNGMGAPLFANYQTAFLYPLSWILYPLFLGGGAPALAWGYTILVPVHLGIAGIGTALLLKEIGINARGQVIAALAFSLCSYFVARASFFSMIWAGVWLPWLVWAIERVIKSERLVQRWLRIIVLALIAANQLLAGHAQLTWYSMIFAGFWALLRIFNLPSWASRIRMIGYFGLGMALTILLASIQLFPTFEYLLQSQRSNAVDYEYAMNYSFWPWRLLGFLLPNLFGNPGQGNYWGFGAYWEDAIYIGLFPFLLALRSIGLIFVSKSASDKDSDRRKMVRFLWVVALVAVTLSLGRNTPIFPWLYRNVPTFDMFQAPTRWMFLAVFSLAMLAGFEAHSWQCPIGNQRKRFKMLSAAGVAISMGTLLGRFFLPQIEKTFIQSFMLLGVWLFSGSLVALLTPAEAVFNRKQTMWNMIAVSVIILDLWIANISTNPYIKMGYFDTESFSAHAFTTGGRVLIPSLVETRLKFEKFLSFRDFYENSNWEEMKSLPLPNLNLLSGVAMVNNFDPLVTNRYNKWMEWLNELPSETANHQLEKVGVGTVIVLQNEQNLNWQAKSLKPAPRVDWRGCQKVIMQDEEILNFMVLQAGKLSVSEECIIVEAGDQCRIEPTETESNVTIEVLRDEVNLFEVSVNTASTGWVRLSDSWYPGWTATIDGQSAKVERVDYMFKGVCVPAGNHILTLRYLPTAFPYVFWLSVGTLMFCLVMVAILVTLMRYGY